jgi:hypothetical protein
MQVQAGDEVAVSVALKPMTRGTVLGSAHDGSVQDSALFIGIGRCEFGEPTSCMLHVSVYPF